MKRRRSSGMTLVEIMVVLVILTLISSAIAVGAMKHAEQAREQVARNDLRAILDALELYKVQRGRYPSPVASLSQLRQELSLKSVTDPWGGEYAYLLEGGKPLIRTYGSDNAPGGEGAERDLTSSDVPER